MTHGGNDPWPEDVIGGGAVCAPSRWTSGRRRLALVVLGSTAVLAVGGAGARGWWDEQLRLRELAVDAELGVRSSSSAWSPSGGGRVDYFLEVHNRAARPATFAAVRFDGPGLAISGRALDAAPVPGGESVRMPLSVGLDCRRWRPEVERPALAGTVRVVTAGDRGSYVRTSVRGAAPLLGVVRALCSRDPQLRIAELSGPVGPA